MRTITRTEITVETRAMALMNRRGSVVQSWCADCGEQTRMVLLEDVVVAGASPGVICQRLEANAIHVIEEAPGLTFICLNSLLKKF